MSMIIIAKKAGSCKNMTTTGNKQLGENPRDLGHLPNFKLDNL